MRQLKTLKTRVCEGDDVVYKEKDYFIFNKIKYYAGTIVKFNDGSYGKYEGWGNVFSSFKLEDGEFVESKNADYRGRWPIVEIVRPIRKSDRRFIKVQKDTDNDNMFYAWIIYITGMLFACITTQPLKCWIVGTYIFYKYRRSQLYAEDRNR